jgi:hypothetical protein
VANDLIGRKPQRFVAWLFDLLGADPQLDELGDWFPGTAIVARSWLALGGQLSPRIWDAEDVSAVDAPDMSATTSQEGVSLAPTSGERHHGDCEAWPTLKRETPPRRGKTAGPERDLDAHPDYAARPGTSTPPTPSAPTAACSTARTTIGGPAGSSPGTPPGTPDGMPRGTSFPPGIDPCRPLGSLSLCEPGGKRLDRNRGIRRPSRVAGLEGRPYSPADRADELPPRVVGPRCMRGGALGCLAPATCAAPNVLVEWLLVHCLG